MVRGNCQVHRVVVLEVQHLSCVVEDLRRHDLVHLRLERLRIYVDHPVAFADVLDVPWAVHG